MELAELIDWTFKMAVFFLLWRAILQDRFEEQRRPKVLFPGTQNEKGEPK